VIDLFPPGTRIDSDGTIVVGGCHLDDVAQRFVTPAIVVSEDALRQRARDYLSSFRSRGRAATSPEILTAIKAGADPARLVMHGNAKSDEELELADPRRVRRCDGGEGAAAGR
jgi:diaminopimelate decarboxylase